ncbi:MAG: hypothetical protein HQK86_05880 [Nitrospinae bacterium]|nr:hypothetical protein [Nitrospinota bacterium]
MKNRRHDNIRKLLSCGAYALFFYLLASPVAAEAHWILEAGALAERNDNVANTNSAMKSDSIYLASLSGGYYEQIATYTGLSAIVDIESRNHVDYGDLSGFSARFSLNLNHKFGVGLQAVRMNAHVSYGLDDVKDNHRDVTLFTAGMSGSSWVTDRLKILVGYEYDKAVPVGTFTPRCGYYGTDTNCYAASYDNPYDTQGNSVFTRVSFLLSGMELTAGYRYRRGDVTADYVPGAGSLYSYTPIWNDAAFPGWASVRYDAQTHSINLGVSGEIATQLSLNLDYARHATSTSVADYTNNVVRLGVAYAY